MSNTYNYNFSNNNYNVNSGKSIEEDYNFSNNNYNYTSVNNSNSHNNLVKSVMKDTLRDSGNQKFSESRNSDIKEEVYSIILCLDKY